MDKLLQLLERDPLLTSEKLAKMLGMKADAVKRKIAAYQKDEILLGYQAVINYDRLNEERVRAVIEIRISPQREGGFDRTAERIAQFDEVTSCFLMSGAYDILIFVEGKTLTQVASFVSGKLAPLEHVQSTATHFMLKTYKAHGVLMFRSGQRERMAVSP